MTIFPICCFSGFTLLIFSNCFSYCCNLSSLTSTVSGIFCSQHLTTAKARISFGGLVFPRYILKSRCCFSTFTIGLILFLLTLAHRQCTSHMVCIAGNHCRKCFPDVHLHPDPVGSSSSLLSIPPPYF